MVFGNSSYHFSHIIPNLPPNSRETIELSASVSSALPDTLVEIINTAVLRAQNDMEQRNNASSDTIYVFGGATPRIWNQKPLVYK